jgi:hypothetical protein
MIEPIADPPGEIRGDGGGGGRGILEEIEFIGRPRIPGAFA